jgi:catechol 2,3-dioxygenase-like lactoylglutathione lyase family enzyme
MLGNRNAVATIAVKNLETARKFYEGTLGLKPVGAEGEEVIISRAGTRRSTSTAHATPVPTRPRP